MLRNNQPINKHTAPLSGEIVSTSVGVIKAVGRYGEKYSVGKIEYQLFSEAGYQYVISPYWDVVDGLGEEGFRESPWNFGENITTVPTDSQCLFQ